MIIIINIAQNTDSLTRSAVVKVIYDKLVKSVFINQVGMENLYLTVDDSFIMMKHISNEQFISIKCNREWTAIVENAHNKSWCTLSNSSVLVMEKSL